jgi:hypothetical protein
MPITMHADHHDHALTGLIHEYQDGHNRMP